MGAKGERGIRGPQGPQGPKGDSINLTPYTQEVSALRRSTELLRGDLYQSVAEAMAVSAIPGFYGSGTSVGVGFSSYRGREAMAVGIQHNRGRHIARFSGTIGGSSNTGVALGYSFKL
jgi:autotransporter adhesin